MYYIETDKSQNIIGKQKIFKNNVDQSQATLVTKS